MYMYINTRGMAHVSRGHIHQYENTKRKLYNCNVNMYFNHQLE